MAQLGSWLLCARLARWRFALVITCACTAAPAAHGETKLDFWHSYIHQPSGVIHYSFQIASYKRGLFFGSCGPSTRSLAWEYDIDLAGPGPLYHKEEMTVHSDLKSVEVLSGTISVDAKHNQATVRLRANLSGVDSEFPGNGTYQIKKSK